MNKIKFKKILRNIILWISFRNISTMDCCIGTMSDGSTGEILDDNSCKFDIPEIPSMYYRDITPALPYDDFICIGVGGWEMQKDWSGLASTVRIHNLLNDTQQSLGDKEFVIRYANIYTGAWSPWIKVYGLMARKYIQSIIQFEDYSTPEA